MLAIAFCGLSQGAEVVSFPDPVLEDLVRGYIQKPEGEILDTDLVGVGFTELFCSGADISIDITGLEYCADLVSVTFRYVKIGNLGPLTGLENLRTLDIRDGALQDLTPLAGLVNLEGLFLNDNEVSDISPLAHLEALTGLGLSNNQVEDISALANLVNLERLSLKDNSVRDVTPLRGLTHLDYLELSRNEIQSITALRENTGLATGGILRDLVFLGGNPLNEEAVCVDIPALRRRLVTVYFAGECTCGREPDVRAPGEPASVTARARYDTIAEATIVQITWDAVDEATEYRVYRHLKDYPCDAEPLSGWTSATEYDDASVTEAGVLYYRVVARNEWGEGPFSTSVTAVRPLDPTGRGNPPPVPGSIVCYIWDSETLDPIVGATVSSDRISTALTDDGDGVYVLAAAPTGQHRIEVEADKYAAPPTQTVELLGSEIVSLTFELTSLPARAVVEGEGEGEGQSPGCVSSGIKGSDGGLRNSLPDILMPGIIVMLLSLLSRRNRPAPFRPKPRLR